MVSSSTVCQTNIISLRQSKNKYYLLHIQSDKERKEIKNKSTFINFINLLSLAFISQLYAKLQNSHTIMLVYHLPKSEQNHEI